MGASAGLFWTNAAFWAAAIALLTSVLSNIYELIVRRYDYWDARNASVVSFRTNVKIRRDDLLSKQLAYSDPDYRRKIIDLITAAFENLRYDRQIEAFDRSISSVNDRVDSLEALTAAVGEWSPQRAGPIAKLLRLSREG